LAGAFVDKELFLVLVAVKARSNKWMRILVESNVYIDPLLLFPFENASLMSHLKDASLR